MIEERQYKFKETHFILTDLRTFMELLKSRIVDHGISPTYRFLKRNTSGQHIIYNYSCTLFGMYGEWILDLLIIFIMNGYFQQFQCECSS